MNQQMLNSGECLCKSLYDEDILNEPHVRLPGIQIYFTDNNNNNSNSNNNNKLVHLDLEENLQACLTVQLV